MFCLLLVILIIAPGAFLDDSAYDFYPLKIFERGGPPPFARGRGHGSDHRGPPGFGPGHGHHGYHEPLPFSHGHGHGHGHQFDFDNSNDYSDCDDITTTTKKLATTASSYKPLITTPSTTTGLIDIRFGGNDRTKRSTKTSDPSTTEVLSRFNSLGHYPAWNTPDPNFKPHNFFLPRLTTCVKSECVPSYECKNPSRRYGNFGFCRWEHEEPYICCEKSKEKLQNIELQCGRSKMNENVQSQAIIGGVEVNEGTGYPWMIAIGENGKNSTIDWYCGGALIGEKTVITAAHCVSKRKADMIRIGEINLTITINDTTSNLQQIPVRETLIHPLYRSPVLYNDLALLYLDKAVKFTPYAQPICLPQKTSISETPIALLTGWGQLSFASERSSILQEVSVQVFNNSYCDQQYSTTQASKRNFPRGILDTQLCAGDEKGGKDACQGDSGSPLVTEEDGNFVLIGLVSAGIGCGSKTFPGVYTRISAFSPWILENID